MAGCFGRGKEDRMRERELDRHLDSLESVDDGNDEEETDEEFAHRTEQEEADYYAEMKADEAREERRKK